MKCTETEKQLTLYASHDLATDELKAIDTHLQQCEPCTAKLTDIQQMLKQVSSLRQTPIPQEIWTGYWQDIKEHLSNTPKTTRKKPFEIVQRSFVYLALAAAVLLITSMLLYKMFFATNTNVNHNNRN